MFGEKSKLDLPFVKLNYFESDPKIDFHLKLPALIRKPVSFFISLYLKGFNIFKNNKLKSINKRNVDLLMSKKPDLVILHGVPHSEWVSLAVEQLKVPFIINMHEYYPLEFEDNAIWIKDVKPSYDHNLKHYFSKANAFFVVCNSIIKKYEKEFNFKNQVLIRNAKAYFNLNPIQNKGEIFQMIHHGICNRSRKIELTIECMKYLPANYQLDLMLIPDSEYFPELVELAKNDPRIKFIPAVPTKEIIPFINAYDLGLFLLPPVNFNYLNALPNKLFEFIQARLAIVVSPNPEMKELVETNKIGAVANDYSPEEFAKAILSLSKEKIKELKANSNIAARIINDEEEQKKILEQVNSLLLCAV